MTKIHHHLLGKTKWHFFLLKYFSASSKIAYISWLENQTESGRQPT